MNNQTLISIIFSTSLILLSQTPASAGVYKWVDDDGQVHYGEQPGNTEAEQVTIRHNETTKPRNIKKDSDETKEGAAEGENTEQTEQQPVEPKEIEISKKEKRKLCNEAKADVAAIKSRGRLREINAKGEYSYLSDEKKQQRLAAAMKKQKKNCR